MLAQDTFGNRSSLSVLTCMQMFSTKQLWRENLIDVSRIISKFSKDNEVEQTTEFLTIKLRDKSLCLFFFPKTLNIDNFMYNLRHQRIYTILLYHVLPSFKKPHYSLFPKLLGFICKIFLEVRFFSLWSHLSRKEFFHNRNK